MPPKGSRKRAAPEAPEADAPPTSTPLLDNAEVLFSRTRENYEKWDVDDKEFYVKPAEADKDQKVYLFLQHYHASQGKGAAPKKPRKGAKGGTAGLVATIKKLMKGQDPYQDGVDSLRVKKIITTVDRGEGDSSSVVLWCMLEQLCSDGEQFGKIYEESPDGRFSLVSDEEGTDSKFAAPYKDVFEKILANEKGDEENWWEQQVNRQMMC